MSSDMDLQNPAINPPRLPSPTKRGYHSRSPSRSPVRNYQSVRDLDPILRGLSPTQTLRAFSSRPDGTANDHLSRSIATTTHAQRELGIKAAQTCLDVRSWALEIEGWEWSGTFDEPEPARKRQRVSAMSDASLTSRPSISQTEEETEEEYYGSMPAQTVREYQDRLDQIGDDLDEVNVEELKQFVLGAHRQAGHGEVSLDDSIGAIAADTNFKHLDDFTALITATILQSLPYLSRLHQLLRTWTVRLHILGQASSYLHDLEQARTDLDHGWAALAVSNHPAAATALQRANATFSRETMLEMKTVIQKQVSSLGRRLDGFLDALEGRQECVPETWIEDFEELEEQYGAWVVQAERKVFEGEWKSASPERNGFAGRTATTRDVDAPIPLSSEIDTQHPSERSTTVATGPTVTLSTVGGTEVDTSTSITSTEPRSSIVGPIVTSTAVAGGIGLATAVDTSTHTTSSGPQSTIVTTITPTSSGRLETHTRTSVEENIVNSNRSSSIARSNSASSSPRKSRSRHVPIVLDGYSDEFARSLSNDPLKTNRDIPPVPQLPFSRSENEGPISELNVKKRAAFLNGDIEKSESLNRSKPAPIVRPFEHASNAFTRLFKRDKEEDRVSVGSRNSSAGSRRSLGRKSSRSKMVYSDLMSPPMVRDDEIANLPRDARPRTPHKVDARVLEYVDMARVPQRSSSERPRSKVPKELTSTTPEHVSRGRSSSKRSSRQDITALPGADFRDTPPVSIAITERSEPETYLPTGLNSPFHSPVEPEPGYDMPENWPLSAEVTPAVENNDPLERTATNTTKVPSNRDVVKAKDVEDVIATDTFENMFISSMPKSPHRSAASGINAANEFETRFGEYEFPRTSAEADANEAYFVQKPPADRSLLRTGRSVENLVLKDPPEPPLPRPVSTVVEAEEENSRRSIDSDFEGSEPEQEEDLDRGSSAAAYFGSYGRVNVGATPPSSKKALPVDIQRSYSTPPVNRTLLRLRIPTSSSPEDSGVPDTAEETSPDLIRRASTTSIGSYPRSELKAVHVKRQSTTLSIASQPQTPLDKDSSDLCTPMSPLSYKDKIFPSPPSVPPRASSLRPSLEDSQRPDNLYELGTAVSNAKRKKPIHPNGRPTSARISKGKMPLAPGEDVFDRHVSEALDSVHASNIKFRTRPGAVTPLPQLRAGGGKLPKAAEQLSKNMTLAPADTSPKKSTPVDPEVKLYHLLQAGRAEPIKLYVRLVGEGERCMVRVGGGWADLADYLRQYAEHHGSRTVSENVELQTMSASSNSNSANGYGKRTFSGPAAFDSKGNARGGASLTPFPPLDRPGTNESQREWLDQEQPRFTMGESDESASPSPIVARQARANTLGSQRSAGAVSRPSTAQSNQPGISSGLRQGESAEISPAGSLSMAGFGSSSRAKAELPEQKARWVEGMIERVNKSASAEKSRGEKDNLFTDMGKAGGTRRLMFRKSSGAAG